MIYNISNGNDFYSIIYLKWYCRCLKIWKKNFYAFKKIIYIFINIYVYKKDRFPRIILLKLSIESQLSLKLCIYGPNTPSNLSFEDIIFFYVNI